MVVRLYAFFSEQTVRMATTPNRSAVRNALAKLVQAHMNLENTTRAKNVLKKAINNHLRATINRNKAINHVLKKAGYKYSNANRANILTKVGTTTIGNNVYVNMARLVNSYNVNINQKTIQKRSMLRRRPTMTPRTLKIQLKGNKKPVAAPVNQGNANAINQQGATTA
jgi:hypothetical protein